MMKTPENSKDKEESTVKSSYKRRSSSGCYAPFKSPSAKKIKPVTGSTQIDKVSLAQEVVRLHEDIKKKDTEIEMLQKQYSESELQDHIDKLHEYNEIKDIAQMIIGKLAEQQSTTTKELYIHFNLELED